MYPLPLVVPVLLRNPFGVNHRWTPSWASAPAPGRLRTTLEGYLQLSRHEPLAYSYQGAKIPPKSLHLSWHSVISWADVLLKDGAGVLLKLSALSLSPTHDLHGSSPPGLRTLTQVRSMTRPL